MVTENKVVVELGNGERKVYEHGEDITFKIQGSIDTGMYPDARYS